MRQTLPRPPSRKSVALTTTSFSASAGLQQRLLDMPLCWCTIITCHLQAARILIQNNVELDVPSNGCQVYVRHYLPLEVAAGLEHYDIVRMLLVAGCQLANAKDSSLRVNGIQILQRLTNVKVKNLLIQPSLHTCSCKVAE